MSKPVSSQNFIAFISYSRDNLRWAETIQNRLESYRYPANLVSSKNRPANKTHLHPIFLDVTDLSTRSPSFMNELEDKLKHSRYLIVLCSHSSARPKSVCHWEINTFLKYHSPAFILPVALEGMSPEAIPKEVHSIVANRNIVLMNTQLSIKNPENESGIFRIIEFLLKVDAMVLNNRYKNAQRRQTQTVWTVATVILAVIMLLAIVAATQSRQATAKERERAKSESQRANFEKKVFPYSLVYGYAKNFVLPLIKKTQPQQCILIIAMPQNYLELDNSSERKHKAFMSDAAQLGWSYAKVELVIPERRPITLDEMSCQRKTPDDTRIYADMASTVTAVKAVVDYLVTDSPYYAASQKEELTCQYVEEFKSCLQNILLKNTQNSWKWKIYFAKNDDDLRNIFDEILAK